MANCQNQVLDKTRNSGALMPATIVLLNEFVDAVASLLMSV